MAVCYSREYGVDVIIARPCHTFGPHFTDSDQRAYAQFIRNVESGEDIVLRSDGGQYRSWCYVVDCAKALCFILLKGETGQAYNIADTHCEASLRTWAETLAEVGGRRLCVGLPDASSSQRVVFDTTRLQQLGWTASGTLKTKLEHTLQSRN
jgi:nucleoside-diphosphate-sugar epimerase